MFLYIDLNFYPRKMTKAFLTIVTGNVPPAWLGKLSDISEVDIWPGESDYLMPRSELIKKLNNSDALVNFADARADSDLLDHAPNLKIIANASVGFDNLNLNELTRRGIWATNCPGFFNFPVAEYIIAGMLYLSRRLGEAERFVREGKWLTFEPGRWDGMSLREQSLGIVGMGAIGRELASMATCIGMKVKYFDAYSNILPGSLQLDELLATSDFVSVNVPLSKETYRFVDRNFMDKMKRNAILINTSRGTVVDQDVLIEYLSAGKLRGAVIDVFENEPVVPDALKNLDNVVITPHMAGGTKSSRKASIENAFNNVYAVLSGNPPLNPVNKLS